MNSLEISTPTATYPVKISSGLRHDFYNQLNKTYEQVLVITDNQVASLYLEDILESFPSMCKVNTYVIPAGEESKNFEMYFKCQTYALEIGLDRKSLIVALGGGVVGDLAGFVAATYMRGIDYVQVPTTILAHDSSVGGKVAINHPIGKNMIGSFYHPKAVIYDIDTLKTLPTQEIRSGLAEIMKEAFISDPVFLEEVLSLQSLDELKEATLSALILKGITVKAKIVSEDEQENGVRSYLNFGHTLGHAIEAELGYGKITHGEAVAIGMLFALYVSEQVYDVDFGIENIKQWLLHFNYPLYLKDVSIPSLINKMKQDKKSNAQNIRLVLLEKIGKPILVPVSDRDVTDWITNFMSEVMIP